MIKIENLRFDFPGSPFSISIENLSVETGEILSVIGPNGAGKTTLLNIIALFEKPKSGHIKVFGRDILNNKDKLALRRQMSYVFSQPYLLNETVYDNVSLPLKLRGLRDSERTNNVLELFKISYLRDNNAATLSQGQKHRVTLARALISKPKLILLDEPFLSLEERYKESLINSLREIIKLNNSSAIFVTQDRDEALALADTVAVMKDGRILQHAKPQEVFTKPASKEVADFVGVETILEGIITKKEDNLCSIKVTANLLEAVSPYNEGDSVFVCIRPEDVVISRQTDSSSARNHFKVKITAIEPWRLGYKLSLSCGFNLVASVTKQSIENLDLKTGDDVFASFKATAIHLIRR